MQIHQVIYTLSPYKALGIDHIPNVVLIKCYNVLIDHLISIFRAIFEHRVCHPWWLKSTTLVLQKIGKPAYEVAKAYCPIGLIDTILKVFSMLCAKHLSYLAENHAMLPLTQFGGRPGRNTMDAMLLVAHKIKDAWRRSKTAVALFLDNQGAFPNTMKDQLLHNMQM